MAEDFLPEARYRPTHLDNWEIDPQAQIGKIVHVEPKEFLSSTQMLTVSGKNFDGIIEISELSIYPLTFFEPDSIPKALPKLFGHCITAKIIGFSGNVFFLSRKSSMEDALKEIRNGQILDAHKISCLRKKVFLDIGAGINAILPIKEVSSVYIESLMPVFENTDFITVKVLAESTDHKNKFIVSSKRVLPQKEISKGDIVLGKPINLLPDETGIFVELSPSQSGIVDIDNLKVCGRNNPEDFFDADIILGRPYSFQIIKERDESKTHFSLRLL